MPNDLLTPPLPKAMANELTPLKPPSIAPVETETRGVNIRGVPYAIWQRARQNALLSGLPIKDFVIRLLAQSEPFRLHVTNQEDETDEVGTE